MTKQDILQYIDQISSSITEVSRKLWTNPEFPAKRNIPQLCCAAKLWGVRPAGLAA